MFWDNFVALCAEKGESPNSVAKKLGITSGSVTGWKKGAVPQSARVKMIADYFGVTVGRLTGRREELAETSETHSEDMDVLRFALYGDPAKDVTKEDLQDVIDFAKYVRQRRKDKN